MRLLRLLILPVLALAATADDWSEPAHVLHELKPVVTYRAKVDGPWLIVETTIQPGWHTFAIDNERRAAEKLAGKASLGIDQPTRFQVANGLEVAGPWYQREPQDFSKPQLRWYSWGFEGQTTFAAKVKRTGSGPANIGIRGQACTDKTCKNIDVSLAVAVPAAQNSSDPAVVKGLVEAR